MSTSYHYLREPVTGLKLTPDGLEVSLWGEVAGTLKIAPPPNHECSTGTIIRMFVDDHGDDSRAPMRTLWGGSSEGCVVRENVRGLDPNLQLVSEYGEIKTVAEIRKLAGEGKVK